MGFVAEQLDLRVGDVSELVDREETSFHAAEDSEEDPDDHPQTGGDDGQDQVEDVVDRLALRDRRLVALSAMARSVRPAYVPCRELPKRRRADPKTSPP